MTPVEKAYQKAGMAASKAVLSDLVDEINMYFPHRKRYERINGNIQFNDYFLDLGVKRLDTMDLERVLLFCKKYRGSLQVSHTQSNILMVRIPSR